MECLGGKEMHGQIFFGAWCRFFCQHGHAMLIYCYIHHRCNADGEAVYCPSELQGQLTMTSFLRTSLPRWTLLGGLVLTWSFQLWRNCSTHTSGMINDVLFLWTFWEDWNKIMAFWDLPRQRPWSQSFKWLPPSGRSWVRILEFPSDAVLGCLVGWEVWKYVQ